MTQQQNVIRAKVGVLELAKQLGNVCNCPSSRWGGSLENAR